MRKILSIVSIVAAMCIFFSVATLISFAFTGNNPPEGVFTLGYSGFTLAVFGYVIETSLDIYERRKKE